MSILVILIHTYSTSHDSHEMNSCIVKPLVADGWVEMPWLGRSRLAGSLSSWDGLIPTYAGKYVIGIEVDSPLQVDDNLCHPRLYVLAFLQPDKSYTRYEYVGRVTRVILTHQMTCFDILSDIAGV